jgi:hypothetical protein
MPKHTGASIVHRRLWQRYPMVALLAGWTAIVTIATAGVLQIHLL